MVKERKKEEKRKKRTHHPSDVAWEIGRSAFTFDSPSLTFCVSPISLKNHHSPFTIEEKVYIWSFSNFDDSKFTLLLSLLNTGSLVSMLGDNGDGVLGDISSEPRGLYKLLRGLGLCLVASKA